MVVELPTESHARFVADFREVATAWRRNVLAYEHRLFARLEVAILENLHLVQPCVGGPERDVMEISRAHPEALELRWLVLGYEVRLAPNDSCADLFEDVVRADLSSMVWYIAATLFTAWGAGVDTVPHLAETLQRWKTQGIDVERWCDDRTASDDDYARFMKEHARRVLDGERRLIADEKWHGRYGALFT
jgi:hypothetical protein